MTTKDFETFVERAYGTYLHALRRLIGDKADDVFQDAVTSFLSPIGKPPVPRYRLYPGGGRFVALFRTALHHSYVNLVRQRQAGTWRNHGPLSFLTANDEPTDNASVPISADVIEMIQSLPSQQQAVILLTAEGFSGCEIAEALGISEPAVSQLKRRARRRLRKES